MITYKANVVTATVVVKNIVPVQINIVNKVSEINIKNTFQIK